MGQLEKDLDSLDKTKEEEEWDKHREEKQRQFESKYRYGSTTVILKEGKYYFWGDISHCGKEDIFHNAIAIKEEMVKEKKKLGCMSYNDLPTFPKKIDLIKEEKDRVGSYKDDLYIFEGGKIKLVDAVYEIEQFQRYCLDEQKEEKIKEVESRNCPKCNDELDVWEIIGFTKEDGSTTEPQLYGFCDKCVQGFNFKILTKEEKKIEKDLEGL